MVVVGKGGSLINVILIFVSCVVGVVGFYLVVKVGLVYLICVMVLELVCYGIWVNVLVFGYVMIDLNEVFLVSEVGDKLCLCIFSCCFSVLVDLDGVLLLFVSDVGWVMSGVEIVVDGGYLCSSL